MTRDDRQKDLYQQWVKIGCRASLCACTGFGKTRVALYAIRQMNSRKPNRTTLVVVPGTDLSTQWQAEIADWNLQNVTVIVINTLINRIEEGELLKYDMLVLDEIHNYAAPKAVQLFSRLHYQFILGLTATWERNDGRHSLMEPYASVFATVTLEEALREGYVAPFRVINIGLELSAGERLKYDKMNREFHRWFSHFNHDLKLAMACLGNEDFVENYARQKNLDLKEVKNAAYQFNLNMAKRKSFLYAMPGKLLAAKRIVDAFEVPTITFSQTTEMPVKLQQLMPDISVDYGSHLKAKQKKANLVRFQTDPTIRVIHTAKALDEGKDVSRLELAIILAATSSSRQNIQRVGRTLRKFPNKQALIVNVYARDTQDEKWLRSRQEGTPNITWLASVEALLAMYGKAVEPESNRKQLSLI